MERFLFILCKFEVICGNFKVLKMRVLNSNTRELFETRCIIAVLRVSEIIH